VKRGNSQKNWRADVGTYSRSVCDLICTYVVSSTPAFSGSAEQKTFCLSLGKMRESAVAIEVLKFATPHSSPEA
jgi:hypothetical protein